ncbi:amidohydrolase family protein [Sphingosinicella sp. CPCC 101087]|uniref:amidohydrolase family protein n=1 Tax=Sphingosinicella sp. CPCC 101087 TaxID=2497754 RepID=UPI00197EE634|nr:amidohydrolase family protein [Sphingosinicella sp. CPCC 101087]
MANPTCDTSPILVRNAMLWAAGDGVQHRDVLFADGRVVRVGQAGSLRPPAGARLIEARNHTLLPGFVDLHIHFSVRGLPSQGPEPRDTAALSGRQLLRSGVTSGRLHLSSLETGADLKRRAAHPCAPLPRLQVGGPRLGGATPEREESAFWGVRSPEDAAAKIDRIWAAGLDWIPIHEAHRFGPGVLQALASAARRRGLRIMGSGADFEELAAVLTIRPDTLDYIDLSAADYPPDLLARVASSGATLAPTLGYAHRLRAFFDDPALVQAPEHFEFMAPPDAAAVLATARRELAELPYVAATLDAYPRLARKFAQLRGTGAPIAIASDVGSPAHFQAAGIWWELNAWRTFGLDVESALRAATQTGAQALGDLSAGNLRVGSHADFILYEGEIGVGPLDPSRIRTVAKAGALFVHDGHWVGEP